jgi:hypothetical protein
MPREVRNPLYGRDIPKELLGPETPQQIRDLFSRKKWKLSTPTREILPFQNALRPILKLAWRDASDREISWMTADLAGLWEVSRTHIILMKKLLKMNGKLNEQDLRQLAAALEVNWFTNASGHMETLKRELNRFTRSLYRATPKRRRKKLSRL